MKRVLITGMSAVGKSSVVDELTRRGYTAVDLDDPAWSRLGRLDDQADGSAVEWLWREDRVAELLSSDMEVVFVAGCAANQGTFRTRFDCMILLTVSEEVTLGRLARRTTNTYGKTGKERARILSDKAHVEPRLRDSAHVVIDTDAPLGAVVDELLAVALS